MIDIENFFVSVYTNNHSVKNIKVPLVNVLRGIRSGEVKDKVLAIRRYAQEGDLKAANALKSDLCAFTVSGVYKGSHSARNLVEPTCLKVLDFDIVPDLEALRAICEADPHTVSCFASPMKGFKVIAHVENSQDRHAEAYELVRMHYEEITGLQVDTSGKDICRTCYFSYDPQCYIAALYTSFVLPIIPSSEEATPSCHSDSSHSLRMTKEDGMTPTTESFAGRESDFIRANLLLHPLREGNRNQGAFKLGCKAAAAGCDFNAVFAAMAQVLCSEGFPEEELKGCLQSAYQRVADDAVAKEAGEASVPQSARVPKCHIVFPQNDETEEEAYLEGEERRRNTPVFPDEVYENIPDLLAECLESDMDKRRRDVRLLSCLVVLSTALPHTKGLYNHKFYTPHVFAWAIAPPASGKGAAEAAIHLLDEVNGIIQGESERQLERYEEDLKRYNEYTPRKRKKSDTAEVPEPEKPKRPPYRSLVIPASISNSRLIKQLSDNGALGGVLFDTEAATLSNTNKKDYGQLDTILCKVFELEPLGYSYFVHGEKPVCCQRPCMAMMLTGTTLQMTGFLNHPGTGMESRILFYTFGHNYHYRSAGEGGDEESTDERFERLAHRVNGLFRFCQEHPMELRFSRSQWDELNHTFRSLNDAAFLGDRDELMSTVRRYAVCVMRLAMVFTRLELFATGDTSCRVTCSDPCFRAALALVLCCYEHCRLLFTSFGGRLPKPLGDPDRKSFPWELLPDRFTTAEAVTLGENHGFSKRTVHRLINKLDGLKINRLTFGCYEKIK